jgi:hypothetical protein
VVAEAVYTAVIGTHRAVITVTVYQTVYAGASSLITQLWCTGIARVHRAAPAGTGIGTVTEKRIIAWGSVIGMYTGSRTVTGIIRTFIAVIGTGRA